MTRPPISAETIAIIDERLAQHLRAKPIAKDSGGTSPMAELPQNRLPAPVPEKPALSLPSRELTEADTWIAYDLTLRCKACGSTVEKYGAKFYCHACERREDRKRSER